ncbi:hypothetical protein PsYK624_173230 [Phanerochaete sordida]|uniref:Uncharacterized protein n=1 Tax=Phanerochaete sordida TaxID=48140 RepID=A0A9P3GTB1_9APHY|nr:hypothetical protein PsYK624_173230 [Phanerochaete sordida]
MLPLSALLNPAPATAIEPPPSCDRDLSEHNDIIKTEYRVVHTRQTTLDVLYHYAEGRHTDYPATCARGHVGHLFHVPTDGWINPADLVAYTQGDPKGASSKGKPVYSQLLRDSSGTPVPCRQYHSTCEYPKDTS